MNQNQFEQTHYEQWEEYRLLLEHLENDPQKPPPSTDISSEEFPARYRKICDHYGLAQSRHYSPALVDKLHKLVLRGHRQLYKRQSGLVWGAINFIIKDFPTTLRQYSLFFWTAFLLFYGPAVALGIATYNNPTLVYSFVSESQVIEMESMYNPENTKIGRGNDRDAETDLSMFGFYIFNNISIGFRTFASGILFGVGSIFLLVFNGLMIGGVAGYLSHPPFDITFWQFVLGHGAFELTAIVISGAAGLLLGYSLIRPGNYCRTDSLRLVAPTALRLVMGAALMLLIAAFIAAFWSSSSFSPTVKYVVAGVNWLLVISYLVIPGRNSNES